ncbi:Uncharacterised protein [Mycobacterium tuberculosis]|nr:Uncharacterised protein [Mycobacterium tuberculosis]
MAEPAAAVVMAVTAVREALAGPAATAYRALAQSLPGAPAPKVETAATVAPAAQAAMPAGPAARAAMPARVAPAVRAATP